MTVGVHPAESNSITNLFHSFVLGFRRSDGGLIVTSGSHPSIAQEVAGTVDWPWLWRPSASSQEPDIPYTGITGSASAYAFFNVELTSDQNPDYEMTQLEYAAEAEDERAFWMAVQAIDWSIRSPEDFMRAVRLALQAGAHLTARHIALDGAKRYPGHAELQKYARVLAPPRATRSTRPPDPTLKANRDWFVAHRAEYRGQWVAVKNGELLGAAATFQELQARVPDWRSATIAQIVW